MQLDDETPWRWPTQCSYYAWYAPTVRGIVMEEKEAWYRRENNDRGANRIRSQSAVVELVSFIPGGGAK
jgi:hypothetical protein